MTDLERMELAIRRVVDDIDRGPMGGERTYALKRLIDELKKMNAERGIKD